MNDPAQRPPLTAARLRELLTYEPETGIFRCSTDRVGKGCKLKAGMKVGGPHNKGYWCIRIDGRSYLAHRLAWLYVTGQWPTESVDHRDRNKMNNAWANLRDVTHTVNMQNNGARGVSFHSGKSRWMAQIVANGKQRQRYFQTEGQALAARADMKALLHASA